jgi:ankyrin repeat protein
MPFWHGLDLFTTTTTLGHRDNSTLWDEFSSCRTTKQFAALCHSWQKRTRYISSDRENTDVPTVLVSLDQILAFDALFCRGLMSAARGGDSGGHGANRSSNDPDTTQPDSSSTRAGSLLRRVPDLTWARLIRLFIQHGAPVMERDRCGVTLLHWACGTGNLDAAVELMQHMTTKDEIRPTHSLLPNGTGTDNSAVWLLTDRDGATPLHWAAAGTRPHAFGCGGHVDVCRYLLSQVERTIDGQIMMACHNNNNMNSYLNHCTVDGNSAVMWASWSGSLDVCQLLVSRGADVVNVTNRNGCTVAHWAASGGNVQVCRYLYDIGVDFSLANHGGNTPLTHAVAFGRSEVVE